MKIIFGYHGIRNYSCHVKRTHNNNAQNVALWMHQMMDASNALNLPVAAANIRFLLSEFIQQYSYLLFHLSSFYLPTISLLLLTFTPSPLQPFFLIKLNTVSPKKFNSIQHLFRKLPLGLGTTVFVRSGLGGVFSTLHRNATVKANRKEEKGKKNSKILLTPTSNHKLC